MLVSTTEPYTREYGKDGEYDAISFFMPADFVNQRTTIGEQLCLRCPQGGKDFRDLVFGALALFEKNAWGLSEDEFRKSARTMAGLALLSLGSSLEASTDASMRAANLARIKHVIGKRLADCDLTLADIARECGISLRYLHELFRDDGRTAYQYLKGERLQRARELLEMSSGRTTVTDVALECGFSDMSHFSKLFKQAFGVSPRDVMRGVHL